jgi:iron complex outermembrane receptor protein
MTGPIREGSPILYRLNVSTEDADSFRDFVYEDRAFIAPSFSVPLGDRTLLTVETEYLHDNRIMDRGVPFYKFNALAVPINVFEGEPDDRSRFNNERIQFILDHRFNDNWALRANYASGWSDEYRINTDTRTLSTTNPLLLTRAYVLQDTQDSSHFGTIDLAGDVGKDTIKQHLLFGTELGTQLDNTRSGGPSAPSVNIFNPNYTPGYFKPAIVPNLTGDSQKSQFAFYGQDLIELSPYVKFVVGTRWTDYNQLSLVKPITEESNYVWIPHVGVSLEPIPEKLSFYVAYGTSFNPVIGFTSSFQPLVPETGWSYEYGIKAKLTDRLTMTLAGYRIVEQNVPETDPTNPLFSVQIGAVASQGFEGQLEGKLTERWSISTSYSYIATEVLSDTNKALIGHRLQAVPDYTVNLWTRYNLIQNEQRVLGFAVGCYGLGYEYADNLNLYRVPSFTRWDCGFYYTEGRLGTSLYVENIGDVHYIASSQSNAILQPGAPTTLRAMISWRF